MNTDERRTDSAFVWNRGGWFGGQLGSSIWILLTSFVFLFQDPLFAVLSLACFAVLNAYGYSLWQSRDKLAAYPAMQRFFLATTVVYAVIVIGFNCRSLADLPSPPNGFNEKMPYWVIALPLALMLFFFVQENGMKRSHRVTASMKSHRVDSSEHQGNHDRSRIDP